MTPAPGTYEWDVFISHASEDKGTLVQPLANILRAFGVRVWYDEFTLKIGDSLSRAIDRGLSQSAFGVIVLSPSFIAKRWPEYELRGLIAKEMAGKKTILPIWHGVTREDVLRFSPTLADALALVSEDRSLADIAFELITVVRPDLVDKFAAHTHFRQSVEDGTITYHRVAELHPGPVRHEHLSDALVGRVRL